MRWTGLGSNVGKVLGRLTVCDESKRRWSKGDVFAGTPTVVTFSDVGLRLSVNQYCVHAVS